MTQRHENDPAEMLENAIQEIADWVNEHEHALEDQLRLTRQNQLLVEFRALMAQWRQRSEEFATAIQHGYRPRR